jgi:hypothetical protein
LFRERSIRALAAKMEAEVASRKARSIARGWLLDAGWETTGSDRHRRGLAVPLAFGRRSLHQLRYRRFFRRYLISLTWAESNPRAVPTSLLDRPAINISRAASVLVLV